jgi:hypothetical protein
MSDFSKYVVYYSLDGVTYTYFQEVTTADVLSATHNTIDARDGTQYYYRVDAVSSAGVAYPSNVVHTMKLQLVNPNNGLALLSWDAPADVLLPTYSTNYEVYRKFDWNYDFVFIAGVRGNSYVDTAIVCGDQVSYHVVLSSVSPNLIDGNCKNRSQVEKDTFYDRNQPIQPTLDSVSINFANNRIGLGWTFQNDTNEINAVIIYYLDDGGFWVDIDTVYGFHQTYWEDPDRNPNDGVYRYRIALLDQCLNASTMTTQQNTIIVTGALDVCTRIAQLTWNAYESMRNGMGKYVIYYSQDGGPLQYSGEVNASSTTYSLPGLVPNTTYKVIVRAVNTSGMITATSSAFEFLFEATETNDFAYLKNVTVVDNSYIAVNVLTSGDTLPFAYSKWYRSVGNATNFSLIRTQSYNGGAVYSIEDHDVEVEKQAYYYKVELINECDAVLATSNISHNIVLTGEGTDAKLNNLQWLSYGTWDEGVSTYAVYRKLQTDTVFVKIDDLVPEYAMYYSDDVSELFEFGSDFIYYVVAIPNPGLLNPRDDMSVSNQITAKQKPTTYIPNAFNPAREYNSTFKPINSFVDTKNYLFTIWTRNGQMVFQTRDPYLGWDGTHEGKNSPMGVYIYHVKYLYPDGTPYEAKGMVTLVR